jgi:L-cysteate sulfo-lyase
MPHTQLADLKERIDRFPRQRLISLPTPFLKLENLSRSLGGPEIYVKRDDLTGLAFGGNKSRKLEFIIADALDHGADAIVTWASLHSNWCMQTAAAARRFGLKPVLILFRTSDMVPEYDGNLLLDYILGADIRIKEAERGKVVSEQLARKSVEEAVQELKKSGRTPYAVAVGGSVPGFSMKKPLGAMSYVAAFVEMIEQARAAAVDVTHIVHATGSGATQAGLLVGAMASDEKIKVIGISVSDEKETFARTVFDICGATQRTLAIDRAVSREDVIVLDEYIKDGYGILNREVAEAIRLVFTQESIVLDPVYTGKAMAALIDLVKKGYFKKSDTVVFFHTGGTPALFPYRQTLTKLLAEKKN